jgi:hypothetical protein
VLAYPSIDGITVWVQTGLHNLLEERCLEFSKQFGWRNGESELRKEDSSGPREKG